MNEILETIDWSPLFISLKTGILATVLAFLQELQPQGLL